MKELLQDLGIQIKGNQDQQKTICPKCSHTRKNKKELCLSINISDGVYNCFHCGWSGNVKTKEENQYFRPEDIQNNLSDQIIKYFLKRGISKATLNDWQISESDQYFGQAQKMKKAIEFKYYQNDRLINIKYRDSGKNFK